MWRRLEEDSGISLERFTKLDSLGGHFLHFGKVWNENTLISMKDLFFVWQYIEGIYS